MCPVLCVVLCNRVLYVGARSNYILIHDPCPLRFSRTLRERARARANALRERTSDGRTVERTVRRSDLWLGELVAFNNGDHTFRGRSDAVVCWCRARSRSRRIIADFWG